LSLDSTEFSRITEVCRTLAGGLQLASFFEIKHKRLIQFSMDHSTPPLNPWIHRLAVLTAGLVMLPIVLGAMTTTYNAGMAFPDWPTSDGQGMFSYPWLKLITDMGTNRESYDKFLEHGHRLAGIVIGIAAIALVGVSFWKSTNRLVRGLALAVLIGVCLQGGLGGIRVQLNERGLAMLHGLFASLVFGVMSVMCAVSAPAWREQPGEQVRSVKLARLSACLFLAFLLMQYALGGLIRHPMGTRAPVYEHLGFGLMTLVLVHGVLFVIIKTKSAWLRTSMRWLLLTVGLQVVLGLLTFAAKFGVPSWGIVAVSGSISQVLTRTGHMVLGVLVIGTASVLVAKTCHLARLQSRNPLIVPAESVSSS